MGGAWLNGAESRIALERRRGAEGHRGRAGAFEGGRKRASGKRERELAGRNKLARNERQIASELSARSPDVIEAAMLLPPPPSLLLRLRVSLCFLPSVSLTFSYHRLCPTDPSLPPPFLEISFSSSSPSLSLFPPSLCANRSPRGEKRDRRGSSQLSSCSLVPSCPRSTAISPPHTHPFPSTLRTADHLDGRLSTHQRPTSSLPTDRLCPRRENSCDVDLLLPPDTRYLAGAPFRRPSFHGIPPLPLACRAFCSFAHVV